MSGVRCRLPCREAFRSRTIALNAIVKGREKRVYKLKIFARWAQKIISDDQLCKAAEEIMLGQYEAEPSVGHFRWRVQKN